MGQTWDGKTCTGTDSTYTFDQANALTGTTTFAGQSDWRLPNVRELQTIVDRSVFNLAINSVVFPGTSSSYFWSASAYSGYSSSAWVVNFYYGYAYGGSKSDSRQARLVRAGQSFNLLDVSRPASDYVDHGDGTVTHTPTGLMWQRCAVGQTFSAAGRCTGTAGEYTWEQAKAVSNGLGGYTDWRLPTADELISLVDYNATSWAINTSIFPDTSEFGLWSASAVSGYSSDAWFVSFAAGGGAYSDGKSSANQVLLVRAPTTTTQVGQTLTLSTGWNLLGNGWNVSLPVASFFSDTTRVTTVWKWDAPKNGWQFYTPTMTAQDLQNYAAGKGYAVLGAVGAGEGFWVNVKQPLTVTLPNGPAVRGMNFQPGGTKALAAGWNLIAIGEALKAGGFNSALSISPPVAGVFNLTTLWAWDNPKSKWYFYSPQLEAKGGTVLTDYIISKGYLDFTATHQLLNAGMGFWVNKP